MTLPNLVSLSGYTDSGKDVAADLLVTRARFVKSYMTKPLEKALVNMNPWIEDGKEGTIERFEDLYTNLGERSIKDFPEARRLLRMLEQSVGGSSYWMDLVFNEVKSFLSEEKKVALSGVQHPTELAEVRELDGVCVWVERPVKVKGGTFVNANDCDLVVVNDGTPKDLYVKLVVALEEYNANKEKNNVG